MHSIWNFLILVSVKEVTAISLEIHAYTLPSSSLPHFARERRCHHLRDREEEKYCTVREPFQGKGWALLICVAGSLGGRVDPPQTPPFPPTASGGKRVRRMWVSGS